jgi:molecular chaperone GrpE (heat shock protein)
MSDSKALTITRHLPVKLDVYRKQALHDVENAEFIEQERLAVHLKNVTDSIKGMIKTSYKKQADAAHAIHNGFEMAAVICRQEIDLRANKVRVIREDTGETVEDRPLNAHEREQESKPSPKGKDETNERM